MLNENSIVNPIVFIDSTVPDYTSLIAGVAPGTEVVLLNSTRSGVGQITEVLAQRTNISSLHIFSHGASGSLQLGAQQLTLEDLYPQQEDIGQWSNALTEDADILIYGCNVASGEKGAAFVQQLSQLTGADVAASDDLTGNAALGGDWDLEVKAGQIEAPLAISSATRSAYKSVLSGDLIWAKGIGGSGFDRGSSIAVDSSGNTYTTGYFNGTVDFDPGAGTANLTSAGGDDIFITKFDSSGNYVWAKGIGGSSSFDRGNSIAVDSSGNTYTTGDFYGTVDFDPGAGTANLTSAGSSDIFITKFDSSGNYVWAKRIGGSSGESGDAIAVDSSGNVYTIGGFRDTVDFDPNAGTANLTSAGSFDVFITKFDSSGNYVWAKNVGSSIEDYGASIAVDSSGNVYTTGIFQGTADFDPGAGTANLTSAGSFDVFITKFDSSGNYVWAKNVGGSSIDYGHSMAVDSSGNVYTTGSFQGTADFNPGAGTANRTSAGSFDIFITKFDSSGNYVWAKNLGDIGGDSGFSIAVDSSGNVYTTGDFYGTVDFDPGAGTANLTSAGLSDIFITKFDSSGNYVWAKRIGGSSTDVGISIAVNSSGNTYTTGYFDGTADFDPGAGTANLTPAGSFDIFIVKLGDAADTTAPTASVSAANVTTAGAATYDFTVTYTDNIAVNVSSLDNSDIRVTGPNGFSQLATFISVNTPGNGTPRTATYRINTPGGTWDAADNGTYTVQIEANQVSDTSNNNVAAGNLGTFNINVPNNPPVLDLNGGAAGNNYNATFTRGAGAVAIVDSSSLSVTDSDNSNLASATVAIANLQDGASEVLAVNNSLASSFGIGVSYASGVLNLTGSATKAQYEQVLRSATYNNTAAVPNTTSRTINFTINDGIANSITATTTLTVNAPATSLGTITATPLRPPVDSVNDGNPDRLYQLTLGGASNRLQVLLTNSGGNADLALFDSIGNLIVASTSGTTSELIDRTGLAAGNYFLRVYQASAGQSVSYRLRLSAG